MKNLFGEDKNNDGKSFALADRMRPRILDEIIGQDHIIGNNKPLRRLIEKGDFGSMIFWGPPGSGKTTLANVIANETDMNFLSYSAVLSGIKEIREVIKKAEALLNYQKIRSILFIDEIHRFNKAQQDAFLPWVEKGTIILFGATTENPSFEIISPLLSRTQVFVLKELKPQHILQILISTTSDKERGLKIPNLKFEDGVLESIADLSNGDARYALTVLEFAANAHIDNIVTLELLHDLLQRQRLHYDKNGDEHYNLVSAHHKSIRGSDPDAALYYLCRMLEAGENRLYILRRLIRMSMEDIGLADPNAVRLAMACRDAFHFLGEAEGDIALAQLTIYLAAAPKSNSVESAYHAALKDIKAGNVYPVPKHLRNAPTHLMKNLGYGKDYKYAHDFEDNIVEQNNMPPELANRKYYQPSQNGLEAKISARLDNIQKILFERKKQNNDALKKDN